MKKSRLLLIASFICFTYTFSQDISLNVISAQGSFATMSDMTLSWTLGESFVETVSNNTLVLTQGFHQSFLESPSLNTKLNTEDRFRVWPNPVSYELNIHLNSSKDSRFKLSLYEINGRIIEQSFVNSMDSSISINVTDLSSGIYILNISSLKGSIIETHKIIKH